MSKPSPVYWWGHVVIPGLAAILLLIIDVGQLLPAPAAYGAGAWWWRGIAIVVLLVMLFAGKKYYSGAWHALLAKKTTMDSLIAISTAAAWIYSTLVVYFPRQFIELGAHIYYDAPLMIIALMNVGQYIEQRMCTRNAASIAKLSELIPAIAHVLRDGVMSDLPIEQVIVGDQLRIKPGEQIPVDGIVRQGSSYIDEAMLTGEPMAVHKKECDQVYAGTLNQQGTLVIEANHTGKQTALQQLQQLVMQTQNSKPHIARIAEQIMRFFVPIVLLIALITVLLWWWWGPEPVGGYMLITGMSVLLIACPCALGLATPMSLLAGSSCAARQGILLRDGAALEYATQIDTVVLDKTGTLTQGKPQLVEILCAEKVTEKSLLTWAASAESISEHPLASVIVAAAKERGFDLYEVDEFTAYPGEGIVAVYNEQQILLGNQRLMERFSVDTQSLMADYEKLCTQAMIPVWVAKNDVVMGLLAIIDPPRAEAKKAINYLQQAGLRVVLLSGDQPHAVAAMAKHAGISEYHASMLPADKAQWIITEQQQNHIVAMVGDGVNDAAALAQAHVGIVMGGGSDLALDSGDVILMRQDLRLITQVISLSRHTMRNVKQNLWGAFAYNVLAIPVAAGILYPFTGILLQPVVAALAMIASSLTVVSNAWRLQKKGVVAMGGLEPPTSAL